ncbi:MAG: ABC transporter permease [Peptococcaceae bacterium]|nr:ABC transporter permease [Peptococcaceae bacterium]
MIKYMVKKAGIAVITLFCVLVFIFVFARLTGNPFEIMYPDGMAPGQLEEYNAKYGLDQSYGRQFVLYLTNAFHGDFGDSLTERRPVTDIFFSRAGETLKLGSWALLISVTLGVTLGILMALYQGNILVKIADHTMSVLYAVPGFILAIFLLLIFSYSLRILPSQGGGSLAHYVMPVACLCIGTTGAIPIIRHVRNSILETLSQDYIRTAVAKGIGKKKTILRHAFRNSLIPILTQISIVMVDILIGSLIIERTFSWPGIGTTLVSSVMNRDFTLVQFSVLMLAAVVILINYLLDILYMVVDPRIEVEGSKT